MKQLTMPEPDPCDKASRISPVHSRPLLANPARSHAMLKRRSSIESIELESAPEALAPEVEGRIFMLSDEVSDKY